MDRDVHVTDGWPPRLAFATAVAVCLLFVAAKADGNVQAAVIGVCAVAVPGVFGWALFGGRKPEPPDSRFFEPGGYRVVLQDPGKQTVQAINAIRQTTGAALLPAKQAVDAAPTVIANAVSDEAANLIVQRLASVGASATVEPVRQ